VARIHQILQRLSFVESVQDEAYIGKSKMIRLPEDADFNIMGYGQGFDRDTKN